MSKFKVGDKVRFIGDRKQVEYEVAGTDFVRIVEMGTVTSTHAYENALELVPETVGMTITLPKDFVDYLKDANRGVGYMMMGVAEHARIVKNAVADAIYKYGMDN